jgi:magnesium-transporting ATPase (P-type)
MEHDPEKWRIETNDRYAKIVASITSLATGALVLPAILLREFLGVPKKTPLLPLLNWWAYSYWICLAISILLGLAYSWLSVKWVKQAWGQKIAISECRLECLLDVTFVIMMLSFVFGVISLVAFFLTFYVRCP